MEENEQNILHPVLELRLLFSRDVFQLSTQTLFSNVLWLYLGCLVLRLQQLNLLKSKTKERIACVKIPMQNLAKSINNRELLRLIKMNYQIIKIHQISIKIFKFIKIHKDLSKSSSFIKIHEDPTSKSTKSRP